jgi:hypothetical protein
MALALASFGPISDPSSIVLVAQAAYHLDDLVPTATRLLERSVPATIVCPVPPRSVLRRWRSSWWRHRELLDRARAIGLERPRRLGDSFDLFRIAALVVRNDWGPTRALVQAARDVGVPTIGWVEGVQDFNDVDTGRARCAYHHVDRVFCLGPYDSEKLAGLDTTLIGSHQLWGNWHGPPTDATGPTVANVNFTYGVLEDARTAWIDDVVESARRSRTDLVLSRHPADRGRRAVRRIEPRTSVHELLAHSPRLISRFSTVCYEALARGVELIYHNPHGEAVGTFTEPLGAFAITRRRDELVASLEASVRTPAEIRDGARPFLERHLVLDGDPPAERAAEVLASIAADRRTGPKPC